MDRRGSSIGLTCDVPFGPFAPDPLEEDGGRLVITPRAAGEFGLGRNEFAAKGPGEDGLGQLVAQSRSLEPTAAAREDQVIPEPTANA